ncbi:MAG: hypothetical protein ABEL76_02540 [Bradymonadaceae bacterium]
MGHTSAHTDNNEDFEVEVKLDGNQVTRVRSGDSDDSTDVNQSWVELQTVSSGTHSISLSEHHEGDEPDNWRGTNLVAIELAR